jgi:hypothetical protein
VFAEPVREERPGAVLERIAALTGATAASGAPAPASQDRLRSALLLAGELEHGAHLQLPALLPALEAGQQLAWLQALSARLADALLASYAAYEHALAAADRARPMADVAHALQQARGVADVALPLRSAEGPALHALYPEQYVDAARRWCAESDAAAGAAAVVGVGSGGPALAAVVAAVLRADRRQVVTLLHARRQDRFDRAALQRARFGLVVGEGPQGQGAAMASAAEALAQAGIARADASFFPGDDRLPRRMAGDEARAWWTATPRYATRPERVLLEGRPLHQALAAALLGEGDAEAEVGVEDLAAGRWRGLTYATPGTWPAACAPFERPKLRLTVGGRRFVFVFAGLGEAPDGARSASERFAALLAARADAGWALAPAAVAHGFVAVPWVDATPLAHRDLDPGLVDHLGRYVASVAQPPLTVQAQRAAVARLERMLCENAAELLGREAGSRARALCERVAHGQLPETPRAYGDGRLSPHHFLRTLAGRILKSGGIARDADHTAVGPQAVLWDLAGASVEWGLDLESRQALLNAHRAGGGDAVQPAALRFYELAYAAFRAGQVALSASELAEDDPELERLERARAFYCAEIERGLFAG